MKKTGNNIIRKLLHNNPLHIVDIGASGGIHPRWNRFYPDYKGILFEPDKEACDALNSKTSDNLIVINSALSNKKGTKKLYCCKKQQVSSVYLPNLEILERYRKPERFKILETITIKTDTLDHRLTNDNIKEVDFIKIDVQGHELPILEGGIKTLSSCIGFEIEVEFASLYKKQPLFKDVDAFVRDMGFELVDVGRTYFKRNEVKKNRYQSKGEIAFGDALYFRSPEQLIKKSGITQEKIIRATCIYLAYGYPELAHVLLELSVKEGKISKENQKLITSALSRFKIKSIYPDLSNKIYTYIIKLAGFFATNIKSKDKLGNL